MQAMRTATQPALRDLRRCQDACGGRTRWHRWEHCEGCRAMRWRCEGCGGCTDCAIREREQAMQAERERRSYLLQVLAEVKEQVPGNDEGKEVLASIGRIEDGIDVWPVAQVERELPRVMGAALRAVMATLKR